MKKCPNCEGGGVVQGEMCRKCHGSGKVKDDA